MKNSRKKEKWDKTQIEVMFAIVYGRIKSKKNCRRCGHKQGWVSKLIQENILINKIISQTLI